MIGIVKNYPVAGVMCNVQIVAITKTQFIVIADGDVAVECRAAYTLEQLFSGNSLRLICRGIYNSQFIRRVYYISPCDIGKL